jgi:hypothetical protein
MTDLYEVLRKLFDTYLCFFCHTPSSNYSHILIFNIIAKALTKSTFKKLQSKPENKVCFV